MPTEFEWIARIRSGLPADVPGVVVGPGDDCAALDGRPGHLTLLTVDAMVDGRHFDRRRIAPEALGRKLAAINASDVAAMGGLPRWAVLSIVAPAELADPWIEGIARGVSEVLRKLGAALVGGNLSGTGGPLVADLALVGEVEPDRVLRRSAALPGDVVAVTGELGGAALGLYAIAHGALDEPDVRAAIERLDAPHPRVAEGRELSSRAGVGAAIDVSDGLLADLGHICEASDVGAEIDASLVPVSEAICRLAERLGLDVERLAIAGGEDYELLFTTRADAFESIASSIAEATGTVVRAIGRIVARASARPVRVCGRDGREIAPAVAGWDHFRPPEGPSR